MKISLNGVPSKVSFNFKSFHAYSDPGHGWVKVPYACLYRLGILGKITSYSYFDKHMNNVFLEEDCDYGTFFNRYKEATGREPRIIHHYSDKSSKIRSYRSYDPKYASEYSIGNPLDK